MSMDRFEFIVESIACETQFGAKNVIYIIIK